MGEHSALAWAMCYPGFGFPVPIRATVYNSFARLLKKLLPAGAAFAGLVPAATAPEPVLQIFLRTRPDTFIRELRLSRPVPVDGVRKAEILRALPQQGEVTSLDAAQRKKLAALKPILQFHDRGSIYVIKVIDVPEAAVALHAKTVLLISEKGLALWDAPQLQALAAHEIGHEYTWDQYQEARAKNMPDRLQQLELYSDAISILTLKQLDLDPSNLTSALDKTIRYNRSRLGWARNENAYPEFRRRQRFHRAIMKWISESRTEPETKDQVLEYVDDLMPIFGCRYYPSYYSQRKVSTGSMRVARRAGI